MDAQLLALLAVETPNRGDVHVFLGHPLADLCDTTTVEPGNGYSPGVWTYGVTLWAEVDGQVITPDLLPAQALSWGFAGPDAAPPWLQAAYQAGTVQITHQLCHLGSSGAVGVDYNRVTLRGRGALTLYVVVRGHGPAGGHIKSLTWSAAERTLVVNGTGQLVVETPQMCCEIIEVPAAAGVELLAILHTAMEVAPDHPAELRFRTLHGFADRPFGAGLPNHSPHRDLGVEAGFQETATQWQTALPARVFAPDPRIARVWQMSAYHILAAMEAGLPRIGAVNYPVFWMRDGVIVLRALDLIGRHDLARVGLDYLAPLDFAGGLGAEADAPGEAIWALANHARLRPDAAWLRGIFPHIQRRVGWIERMLTATEPVRALTEARMPRYLATPGVNMLCLPAKDGLIHGRMDWHSPDFYINCWALAGLRLGAWAAARVEQPHWADQWSERAAALEQAIAERLLPAYGNERDPAATPYPTQALAGPYDRERLREPFEAWYRQHRLDPQGQRLREPLWTYFEAAQIHNALLLGMKQEAWINLDGMLQEACMPWGIAAWVEGTAEGNERLPFANTLGARGWLQPERALGGNMPHNWTSAEMLALLRSLFVLEHDGELLLGLGVPPSWLTPGCRFGVSDLPTELGVVSYEVSVGTDGVPHLSYSGPAAYLCAWE